MFRAIFLCLATTACSAMGTSTTSALTEDNACLITQLHHTVAKLAKDFSEQKQEVEQLKARTKTQEETIQKMAKIMDRHNISLDNHASDLRELKASDIEQFSNLQELQDARIHHNSTLKKHATDLHELETAVDTRNFTVNEHAIDLQMTNISMQLQKLLNGPAAHLSGLGGSWRTFGLGATISYWYTSSGSTWSPILRGGMNYSNGILTVPQDGLYYVYIQLHFYHNGGRFADARFSIDINGSQKAYSNHHSNDQNNSYYMARLLTLQKGDRISIVNRFATNHIAFYPEYSFFGAFKLP